MTSIEQFAEMWGECGDKDLVMSSDGWLAADGAFEKTYIRISGTLVDPSRCR
jgi:hypothetical protein